VYSGEECIDSKRMMIELDINVEVTWIVCHPMWGATCASRLGKVM